MVKMVKIYMTLKNQLSDESLVENSSNENDLVLDPLVQVQQYLHVIN